jgi:hypothetical protein
MSLWAHAAIVECEKTGIETPDEKALISAAAEQANEIRRSYECLERRRLGDGIRFRWAAEIDDDAASEAPELVEDLMHMGAMSCMYGAPNVGKSYFAAHLCFSLAESRDFLGRRVRGGPAIYVAGEGASSIRQRIRAMRRRHGLKLERFGLIESPLNLLIESVDVGRLIGLITDLAAEIAEPVALVVIDTLARAMAGADENSAQDMGRLIAAGDQVRLLTGAHVMFVHHSGKDVMAGARGSSALKGALDTEFEVTADESSRVHMIEARKQRDLSSKGIQLLARFEPVELGFNQWGKPITACTVEFAGDSVAASPREKVVRGIPKLAYDAISKSIAQRGRQPHCFVSQEAINGVTLEEARQTFNQVANHLDSKHRASRFSNAISSLKASGHIGGAGEWIWIASRGVAPNSPNP